MGQQEASVSHVPYTLKDPTLLGITPADRTPSTIRKQVTIQITSPAVNNPTSSQSQVAYDNPHVRKMALSSSPGILRNPSYNLDSLNTHTHYYDLSLTIKKPKDEDDEEPKIQKPLQKFLDIMLQADPFTLIPPYFELERSDKNIPD